ncbi:hypothetical protein F8M41_008221 [Gigaspora margarita]|uniref:Uncharacterized protein n=1 Tax=Gigaspora margarita TaxID=4874 RepID=A0A8H4A2S0_GIGMA|nr:hypothetical protein F8M41_008221 [Gigaspora margarita]
MNYNLYKWLNKCNQVVVEFIKNLVQNAKDVTLSQEKLFKTATAINLIYRAHYRKYVLEIQLAFSVIKYSIDRSRMIINIDNHITNSGSKYRFQKWLEELSKNKKSLPDYNEQRGQKNYLDQGFNIVIYHVVTSFVVVNMASLNKIQYTSLPWAYNSLNRSQYKELFDISPQMQKVFDEELYDFLTDIFNLLVKKKLASNNTIDFLISSIGTNITCMKICSLYNQQNIENQKRKCPECGMQLLILAEMQKEEVIEDNITNKLIHSLVFKPYSITNKQNITSVSKISYTQQVIGPSVNVPEIHIPDPININPNSIANVEKFFHILK